MSAARAAASADPFFDQPYEPTRCRQRRSWEAAPKATPAPARAALSPNIKPKRKVASLLGGGVA